MMTEEYISLRLILNLTHKGGIRCNKKREDSTKENRFSLAGSHTKKSARQATGS